MQNLIKKIIKLGAKNAAIVETKDIIFDRRFREQCIQNACGCYGKNYTCPPDVGDIDDLITDAKSFKYALVYQTIEKLQDSFDYEGMMLAGKKHHILSKNLHIFLKKHFKNEFLHLGAGGCRECEVCGKVNNTPCRHPEFAFPSLEAYGISVSDLAKISKMNYINGENTVTYFGTVLFKENINEI